MAVKTVYLPWSWIVLWISLRGLWNVGSVCIYSVRIVIVLLPAGHFRGMLQKRQFNCRSRVPLYNLVWVYSAFYFRHIYHWKPTHFACLPRLDPIAFPLAPSSSVVVVYCLKKEREQKLRAPPLLDWAFILMWNNLGSKQTLGGRALNFCSLSF